MFPVRTEGILPLLTHLENGPRNRINTLASSTWAGLTCPPPYQGTDSSLLLQMLGPRVACGSRGPMIPYPQLQLEKETQLAFHPASPALLNIPVRDVAIDLSDRSRLRDVIERI